MGAILVGTSGYSYDDWVGPVYPPGTTKSDFLALYAERFRMTELNFTYYAQPSADGLLAIATKTPPGFLFTVKAHGSLTHERRDGWERGAERFADAVSTLQSVPEPPTADASPAPASPAGTVDPGRADRLAGILLQFPFSFHYDATNRRYLASVCDALAPMRRFVEFRNAEWDQPSVWTEMERRSLGLVIPDLPHLDGLPRTAPRLTAPWGYVRFHGRNHDTWWSGTNVTRYDYLYRKEELRSWVGPVEEMARQGEAVIATFNNHFNGQAVRNAEEFAAMV